MPGGEAANCALVLRSLGARVWLDGCYLGDKTADAITQYFALRDIDCSAMRRLVGFEGWQDIVFCDGHNRTVFGQYAGNLFKRGRLWSIPSKDAVKKADCVTLDPFFGAESDLVAKWCVKHGKPYITIDCRWDTPVAQMARAVVCSQEFLNREYAGADYESLLGQYASQCKGLVIFTFGGKDIWYALPERAGHATFTPFQVPVVDTLGAGDAFRAGIVYGMLKGWPTDEIIPFAAACAGVVCTRFPSVEQPPTMEEVRALMSKPR
jgi:sugar/nucleoside kinase (ribokinase family)